MSRYLDTLVVGYTRWVIRWRWLVLLACLAGAGLAAVGAKNLGFSNDYRNWFSEENPELQAFEAVQNIYTKQDNVLIVLEPRDGNVFSPHVLSVVEELTEAAWQLPFAIRVDSITNFQHTQAEEDDLIVEDLVSGGGDLSAGELAQKRSIALGEPVLRSRLISPDASVTGVNVTFQLPEKEINEVTIVTRAVRELVAQMNANNPDIDTYLTGVVMLNNAFAEASENDIRTLIPLMYVLIIIALVALTRSAAATVTTLFVIFLSVISTMGLVGWAGMLLTPTTSVAPTLIMTLAVADSIHILITMLTNMRQGMSKTDALVDSMRLNVQPVLLTSVTTAIGFLAMNFSDAPPFWELGNITAMGIMLAFVFSVTFLPAALAVLPMRAPAATRQYQSAMDGFANFVIRKRWSVLTVTVVASAILLAMIPRNELNDEFVKYFDYDIPFRTDTEFTVENLTGIYQVQFSLDTKESNGVSDPGLLATVDSFASWLRAQPEVIHVSTITDTFKNLNKNLHGDDPSWYRLPDDRATAAQYLLLYELSLPYGLDLNNQLNIDKSSTLVNATATDLSTVEMRALAHRAETWLDDHSPDLATVGIGTAIMFAHISERNIEGMLTGTFLSLILISGLLVLALRSLKLGIMSLIPNLLPAGLAFGLWGLFVGQINMIVSTVTAITLGIVVDDCVHFLSKYLRARREKGLGTEDAIRYAFSSVGTALVITSAILCAGFLVLAQSDFGINSQLAQLAAITIGIALAVDFLLLPPLLLIVDRDKEPVPATGETNNTDEETKDEATVYAPSN